MVNLMQWVDSTTVFVVPVDVTLLHRNSMSGHNCFNNANVCKILRKDWTLVKFLISYWSLRNVYKLLQASWIKFLADVGAVDFQHQFKVW